MRKVYVKMTVNLVLNMNEETQVEDVIEEVTFISANDGADIENATIEKFEVTDSK